MLAIQGSGLDDALNGFGHVQPGAAQWGIEQANPLREAPLYQGRTRNQKHQTTAYDQRRSVVKYIWRAPGQSR